MQILATISCSLVGIIIVGLVVTVYLQSRKPGRSGTNVFETPARNIVVINSNTEIDPAQAQYTLDQMEQL